MSSYADLAARIGDIQARRTADSGRIWGETIANLGQLPLQIQQQSLLKAREQRLTQQAASEKEITDLRLQDARDNRLDQTLTGQLVTANTQTDEHGHMSTNHDAVYQDLMTKGRTKAAEAYLNFANAAETHANEVQARVLKTEADKQNWRAERLSSVIDAPPEQRPARYAVLRGTLGATASNDPIFKSLPPDYPGDDAFQQLYDSTRTHEARLKDSAAAVEEALKKSTTAKNLAEAKKAEAEAAGGGTSEWAAFTKTFAGLKGRSAWGELSPQDQRDGYKAFTDLKADPAAQRQWTAISAQIAQQQRSQTFTEQQSGRKELTDKVEAPYQKAIASAQLLRDTVTAAQSGNKIAARLQNLNVAMGDVSAQGFNRFNAAELALPASAGNAYDHLVGWLSGATEGEPVPPNIQKNMLEFADLMERGAYQQYIGKHRSVTKRYGLSDEPPLPAPSGFGGAGANTLPTYADYQKQHKKP